MMQIGFTADAVMLQNGQPVTTSRKVAEVFNKQHAHVLRSINSLDCSREFNESNFGLVNYTDSKGEMRPEYIITRDGFTFLAMGFTGKAAARFKEQYINAFNAMEAQLRNQQSVLANSDDLLLTATTALVELLQRKQFAEKMAADDSDHLNLPNINAAETVRKMLGQQRADLPRFAEPQPKKLRAATGLDIKIESGIEPPVYVSWKSILEILKLGESVLLPLENKESIRQCVAQFHRNTRRRFARVSKGAPRGQFRIFRVK